MDDRVGTRAIVVAALDPGQRALLRRAVALVAGVQFFVALEGSLLLPLGPTLSRVLAFEPSRLGYLNSTFLIAAALAGLVGSIFLDRFQRRAALGLFLAGLAACTALAGLATNLETLMACRFLAGLCGGPAAALGLAVIGDAAPVDRRAAAIGAVAAGSGLAVILGVPFALILAEAVGWRAMLFAIGAVGLALAAGAVVVLPEGMGETRRVPLVAAMREFSDMIRAPGTTLVLATSALVFASTLMLAANLAPYFVFNLGVAEGSLKYIWMAGGVFGLLGSQGASRLAQQFGPAKVLRALSALTVATFFMLFIQRPLALPVIVLFCSFMVCANGRIVMANTISSLASRAETRGRFMSLVSATNQTASALAIIFASLVLQASASGVLAHVQYLGAAGIVAAIVSPILATTLQRRAARAAADAA